MENKNKKSNNTNNFHYCRYNSTKIKQNGTSKSSKEVNNYKKNENSNAKNDNSNKKLNRFNYFNNDDNNNNKGLQYKINNIENNNSINTEQEQINKLKKENEELQKYVDKNNKIIFNLKDRCHEQKSMIEELMKKIDEIKKFIPENVLKMEKKREEEKDKFEEQLAIAAVEEQIIKELCPNSSNQQTMEKIFNGEKDSTEANIVKNKIMNIPQIYYKKNEFDNFDCFICYDEFKDNECLKQLMCKHIFHKECLSQWLMNSNNCPICNQLC
jgi:predicted RNase H-like nuclease (RuvC/YqgF family)